MELKIPADFRRKKKQVQKSPYPILLALMTVSCGCDLDDYDRAVFGKSNESAGFLGETLEMGFQSNGSFATSTTPVSKLESSAFKATLVGCQLLHTVVGFCNRHW